MLTAYTIAIVQNAQALQYDQMHVALQTARNQASIETPLRAEELMTAHFNLAVLSNETCHAIRKNIVLVNTWVFILKTIQWQIHAGSWSKVNCLAGSPYEALYKVLMNINEAAVSLTAGLGLDGDWCIRVIPRQNRH